MNNESIILSILKENNGVIEAKQVREAGVDNKVLQRMVTKGVLERISRGLYVDANTMHDEYVIAQYRCKKGLFSHDTALYFHELSDRTPIQITMTIPSGYNTRLLNEPNKYKFFYSNKIIYKIGIMHAKTNLGNSIKLYDKERTICDCIIKKDLLEQDLVVTSIKRYMKEPGADFARLLKYAELFNIREQVRQLMEVLA